MIQKIKFILGIILLLLFLIIYIPVIHSFPDQRTGEVVGMSDSRLTVKVNNIFYVADIANSKKNWNLGDKIDVTYKYTLLSWISEVDVVY